MGRRGDNALSASPQKSGDEGAREHEAEATVLLARDRRIGLVGIQDKEQVVACLERMGFHAFVDDFEVADVVVVLGIERCRMVTGRIEQGRIPAVLYTGKARFAPEEDILDRLNAWSVAIPANTPGTAAQHAAMLLMVTGKGPG